MLVAIGYEKLPTRCEVSCRIRIFSCAGVEIRHRQMLDISLGDGAGFHECFSSGSLFLATWPLAVSARRGPEFLERLPAKAD